MGDQMETYIRNIDVPGFAQRVGALQEQFMIASGDDDLQGAFNLAVDLAVSVMLCANALKSQPDLEDQQ